MHMNNNFFETAALNRNNYSSVVLRSFLTVSHLKILKPVSSIRKRYPMILHTMSLHLLVRCVENICFFTGDGSRQHALGILFGMLKHGHWSI